MPNPPWGNQRVEDWKKSNALLMERVPNGSVDPGGTIETAAVKGILLLWKAGSFLCLLMDVFYHHLLMKGPIIFCWRLYLQCTIIGPLEGGASSLALSTSCTSSRRGGALSGVFWSGHDVYQYCWRLRSSSPHWRTQTHQHTDRYTGMKYRCDHIYMLTCAHIGRIFDQPCCSACTSKLCYLGICCYDNNERRARRQKKSEVYKKRAYIVCSPLPIM